MTLITSNSFELNTELLKTTLCKDLTNQEFDLFIHMCKHTRLDPILKQIYAIKRGGKMTTQTSIDGFRLIAERTGKYSPGREATYTYDGNGKLLCAVSYIKKMTDDGTWHEVSAPAYWSEYVQEYNGKPSNFWAKMPHTMLAKCAEALALRKAFPADLSGLYTTDEMAQADSNEINVTPVKEEPPKTEEPDISVDEVKDYINKNWQGLEKEFMDWFEALRFAKKWNYREALKIIQNNLEHTKTTFMGWQAGKVGI